MLEPKEAYDNDLIYQDFHDMQQYFLDKETEANWLKRDESIILLRRYAIGNILQEPDIEHLFVDGIKPLVPGIIKAINSLRTTLSTHGCELVEDLARAKEFPHIMESVFPHLVKLCASTKKIAASKAEQTANTIISHSPYHLYFMKEIWSACQDKNVQPRKSAALWLKTFVSRHRQHKASFEKGEGLPLFEQCLKKGLSDGNADVRKSMRPAYWAFIRLWPQRSEDILSTLSDQHRKALLTETADVASTLGPAKTTALAAAATTTAPKPKPSIKDAIAAKRQAAKSVPEPEPAKSTPEPEPTATLAPATTTAAPKPKPSAKDRVAARREAAHSISQPEPTTILAAAATTTVHKPSKTTKDRIAARREAAKTTSEPEPAKPVSQPKPTKSILEPEPSTVPAGAATATVPKPNQSIKDLIAARKPAAYPIPESETKPIQSTQDRIAARRQAKYTFVASDSTNPRQSHMRSLSSAPVRPSRLARKPTATVSAIEVPKATIPAGPASPLDIDRPLTPLHLQYFTSPRSGSPIDRPTSAGSMSETIIEMAKGAWSSTSRPLSPGTIADMAKAGWSEPTAETSPSMPPCPPSPAGSSATVVRRSSQECEALRQFLVDGPIKPVKTQKAPVVTGIARKALGQLPVNEPVRPPVRDLSKVKIGDMSPKERWVNVERIHRKASPRIKFEATDALREQLRAHIRTLKTDAAGIEIFHGIQRIIKTNWLVLDDEQEMFDELLFEILGQMEDKDYQDYSTTPTGHDRNTQLLLILRLLLENHCSLMMYYFPRVLCALISASRNQHFETHMQPCLQETVKQFIREFTVRDLEDSIDAILEVFETHSDPSVHPQEMGMGLYMLRLLMKKSLQYQYEHIDEQEKRIAAFGYQACKTVYPEMRQLAIRMFMQYRIFIDNDDRFWRHVGAAGENCARLMAYYYEKEKVEQRLEVERLMLAHAMDEDVD
ncbi:MAG: hypothetical protein L6R35_002404 [Caloplaca aegaea]|nr:MAG: hypothetical protein L6R35_002404 [Caloplaca aegaea]